MLAVLGYYVIIRLCYRLLEHLLLQLDVVSSSCRQYVCSRIPWTRCIGGRQHHRPDQPGLVRVDCEHLVHMPRRDSGVTEGFHKTLNDEEVIP